MTSVWLMYHSVFRDGEAPAVPRSASTYHLSRSAFVGQLETIRASGHRVGSAGDWLKDPNQRSIVLTFDDGWSGSFEIGVPEIRRMGWKATFYVTRDFIGREAFCDDHMLKDAAAEGMEIGVHGTTHRMLSGCSHREAVEEFQSCKSYLEDLLGVPIVHASLPGGDLNRTVLAAARDAGLQSLSTSIPGVNRPDAPRMLLKRVAMKDSTTAEDVGRYCRFDVRREAARAMALQVPKAVLGIKTYTHLRRWILNERTDQAEQLFEP